MTAFALLKVAPVRKRWPVAGLPSVVFLGGRRFVRSAGLPRAGAVAHYRHAVPRMSAHAYVLRDGTYLIDHLDEVNPHDAPLAHLWKDVL